VKGRADKRPAVVGVIADVVHSRNKGICPDGEIVGQGTVPPGRVMTFRGCFETPLRGA
jgi:hypothetical protein